MGILTKMINECPKGDFAFTVIKLVSLCDGAETVINIIDARYSIKGVVVKTIEFPSFEGEFAPIYQSTLAKALELAVKCENAVRAGRIL